MFLLSEKYYLFNANMQKAVIFYMVNAFRHYHIVVFLTVVIISLKKI